ncbi:MAG TPA: hypothetical protein VFQ82_09965 [Stellaceae bacterium]|jgi:hypothetical protein|nr:hypothetical protein [Stellaceae bacterium]
MAATFDTLTAARRLKEAGASEPMAEAIVETIREARDFDLSQLATKGDLDVLRAQIELRLIRWMIGVGVAAVIAIVGALTGVVWAATQIILHAGPH